MVKCDRNLEIDAIVDDGEELAAPTRVKLDSRLDFTQVCRLNESARREYYMF